MRSSQSRLEAVFRNQPWPGGDRPGKDVDARTEVYVRLLVESYHSLYGFILSLVGNSHSADDLMQECSLLLWRKFDQFDLDAPDPEKAFLRWARTFARNLARNFHRLRRAPSQAFGDELLSRIASTRTGAEELLELRKEALRSCVERLAASERRLLQACYARHATIDSAASHLGRTPNSVYKALRRIRHKLFGCINRTLGLEADR